MAERVGKRARSLLRGGGRGGAASGPVIVHIGHEVGDVEAARRSGGGYAALQRRHHLHAQHAERRAVRQSQPAQKREDLRLRPVRDAVRGRVTILESGEYLSGRVLEFAADARDEAQHAVLEQDVAEILAVGLADLGIEQRPDLRCAADRP